MKLVIGLGNPGTQYEKTRHNAGFLMVDYFRENMPDTFSNWKKNTRANALISEGRLGEDKILLVKPQTFMNNSGQSVSSLAHSYDIAKTNIVVIHDDYDVNFGSYKVQTNRGPAGHNGVISLIDHLNSQEFHRVRIGIKPSNIKIPDIETHKFVLEKFTKRELDILDAEVFPEIFNACNKLLV